MVIMLHNVTLLLKVATGMCINNLAIADRKIPKKKQLPLTR